MRTWILYEHKKDHGIMALSGPSLAEDEQTTVVELEPILDLFDRHFRGENMRNQIWDFLRENGRL